jgi:hypothetical protein
MVKPFIQITNSSRDPYRNNRAYKTKPILNHSRRIINWNPKYRKKN